jgi:16S rRNA (guanine966-N2)-methyltransferase
MNRPHSTPRARGPAGRRGAPPRQIRIIGGAWRRTLLPVIDEQGLRPTPDRVRETLFNWLDQRLDGMRCLDMFAGSGGLGFEAASRGAARVLMVERSSRAARQLRAIQEKLHADAVEIVEADAIRFAATQPAGAFDVVFLDPPFGAGLLDAALRVAAPLVGPDGVIYVETDARLRAAGDVAGEAMPPGQQIPAGWAVIRDGKAGAVHYHLLRRNTDQ